MWRRGTRYVANYSGSQHFAIHKLLKMRIQVGEPPLNNVKFQRKHALRHSGNSDATQIGFQKNLCFNAQVVFPSAVTICTVLLQMNFCESFQRDF